MNFSIPSGGCDVRCLQEQFEREELMRLALLTDGVDDVGRARALETLRALWCRHRAARAVDPGLDDLFKGLGQRIMQADDIAEAAKKLFQPAGPRGAKVKHAERDLALAVEVEKLRIGGASLESAIAAVAGCRASLSEDRIQQIYWAQVHKQRYKGRWGLRARFYAAKLEGVRI